MVIDSSALIAILCSYALARSRGEPLLYKGDDFPRTDLRTAALLLPPGEP